MISEQRYLDFEYAKIDIGRKERTEFPEIVFWEGKPKEYLREIYLSIYKRNDEVFGIRANREQYEYVKREIENIENNEISHILKGKRTIKHVKVR